MALTKISGDVIQSGIDINIGIVTATQIDGNVNGNVNSTGVSTFSTLQVGASVNISSGVVTATTFSGSLSGNATGLSGTPNITVGAITAASATFSGNVSVAGTVTYEDVTNVDSVGIITARSGIIVNDGGVILVGSGTSTGTASQPLQVNGGAYVSGNLGIGTTNPVAKLQVQSGYIKLENNLNGENTLYLRNTNTAGNIAYSVIRFSESNDVGNAGNAYIHYFNSGYNSNGFWDANSLASGTTNGNINFNVGGNNQFKVWTNSNQRFAITGTGNVGIATTTPAEKLSVNGRIESLQDGVGEGGQLILRASPTGGVATQYRWSLDNYDNGTRGNDRLRFIREVDSDASSGVEFVSINTDGNIQFRTAAPKILNTSGNVILRQSGSVIQVVTNTVTTSYSLTATTETVIYNPMITITPTNSNSLIFFDIQFFGYHNPNNDFYTSLWVRRNSSGNAISSTFGTQWGDWTRNFNSMVAFSAHADYHFSCWDLPGTTSAVNYLLTGLNHQASRNFALWHGSGASNMRITAFEVAQ